MNRRLWAPLVAVAVALSILIPTTFASGEPGTTLYAQLGTTRFPGGQGAADASLTFNGQSDIVLRIQVLGPAGTVNAVRVYVDGTCADPGEWVINRTTTAGPNGPFLEINSNSGVNTIQVNQLDIDRIRSELAGNPNETFALMVARLINGQNYRTCTAFGTTALPPLTTTTTTSASTTGSTTTSATTTTTSASTTGSTTTSATTTTTTTTATTASSTTSTGTGGGGTTTTVNTIPGAGWIQAPDNTTGRAAVIVPSPVAGLGTESVQLAMTASSDFVGIGRPLLGPLSDLSGASWMTFVTGASGTIASEAASLRFGMYRLGGLSEFTTMAVSRPNNGTVNAGVWQTTTLTETSLVWQTNATGNFCLIASPCTFAAFKAMYPNAALFLLQVAIGTSVPPATSYVDGVSLTRGGVTESWDFELP
jgi:hypothetical protein